MDLQINAQIRSNNLKKIHCNKMLVCIYPDVFSVLFSLHIIIHCETKNKQKQIQFIAERILRNSQTFLARILKNLNLKRHTDMQYVM